MANYSIGTVKCDRQLAAAYIAYMIVGSYFKDARIKNWGLEKKARINYSLLSPKEQETQEEKADSFMIGLGEDFLERIESLRCEVHIRKTDRKDGRSIVCLWFETGFEEIWGEVDERGKISIRRISPLVDHKDFPRKDKGRELSKKGKSVAA